MTDQTSSPRVAFLGPEGTYTHAAVQKFFGSEYSGMPVAEIPDIFANVEAGAVDFGVVPVENSSEGSVTATLDCFLNSNVLIYAELMLRIRHCLLAPAGRSSTDINTIVSHQQSLGQCRYWLDKHFPGARRLTASSNAEAALLVSKEPGTAAIAGKTAAEIYHLDVLSEGIEDNHDNTTRFLIISRNKQLPPTGRDKTSLIILAHNEPGTLFKALEPFHRFEVSLSKLESRPSRITAWSYSFYVDFEGHAEDQKVKAALADLQKSSLEVKNLGSYPAASPDEDGVKDQAV